MLLRFGNIIYDLKYCEKIALFDLQRIPRLYLRFVNGVDEVIDLRKYECDPEVLFEWIYNDKNNDDVTVEVEKKEEEKDVP
jgi:hypothetical protein